MKNASSCNNAIIIAGVATAARCRHHPDDTLLWQRRGQRAEVRGLQVLHGESAAGSSGARVSRIQQRSRHYLRVGFRQDPAAVHPSRYGRVRVLPFFFSFFSYLTGVLTSMTVYFRSNRGELHHSASVS